MQRTIYKFKDFLSERFPFPVRKLPVHTFLGCPHRKNRSGSGGPGGSGGCIYCYNPGFSDISADFADVSVQISDGIAKFRERGYKGRFLVYFQTDTNTYADITVLEPWWRTIEQFPQAIAGLAVGTRPDCLNEDILTVLADIAKKNMVWLELGLQSASDKTLSLINRGHDYDCFVNAVIQVKKFSDIFLAAHIILGLPGENYNNMLHTIHELNRLSVDGVKIHHLQVIKHTVLADWYKMGKVNLFTENEYVRLLIELLPHLSPNICIHRLIGDIKNDLLLAPQWLSPKTKIIQMIEARLNEAGEYQGRLV